MCGWRFKMLCRSLVALWFFGHSWGCMASVLRDVRDPRAGRALGDQMCIVYSQRYQISLGGFERFHTFDVNKYSKVYRQLVADRYVVPMDVFVPEEITEADILRVHTPDYLHSLTQSKYLAEYLEFWPAALAPGSLTDAVILRPFRYVTGGTLLAARLALQHGMAVNLGGGYHHAEPDVGGGFCIYADMPIAIRVLQAEGKIKRALVVDLDVHQGNGTAECFWRDREVYTFDMHQEDIYPIPKSRNDRDVRLPAGTTDAEFLEILIRELPRAFDRAKPDIVFLQAGVDGLAGDPLADFELTADGMARRDAIVFAEAGRRNVPIVMVLGGGYTAQAWKVQYSSIASLIEEYCPGVRASRVTGRSSGATPSEKKEASAHREPTGTRVK